MYCEKKQMSKHVVVAGILDFDMGEIKKYMFKEKILQS